MVTCSFDSRGTPSIQVTVIRSLPFKPAASRTVTVPGFRAKTSDRLKAMSGEGYHDVAPGFPFPGKDYVDYCNAALATTSCQLGSASPVASNAIT